MSKPREFCAILVGGSVAGLTMAHMLSQAKINYILLEARDTLSPQLGAGIVLMPNGSRILDQLGLLDEMRGFLTRMAVQHRRKSDGTLVNRQDWPTLVEERLGYPLGIAQRKMFLSSLYEQLEDKSKILLNKKVLSFEHGENEVRVKCQDGSEYVGDLVVGVDGVHSRTRQEMQRIAEEEAPGLMKRDLNKVTAEYNAIFGISTFAPSLSPGDSHTASDIDRSSLMFVSEKGLPQWFFFSKLDKKYFGQDIPRYTREEMEKQVAEYADFHFTDKITLRDLMDNTTSISYLPLEEANHEFWSWGRVVCVGDSIHKMTPNMGQGGNQAIESAATLTNSLLSLLTTTPYPTTTQLTTTLKTYQDLRIRRAKMFVNLSGMVTRDDALATLRHTLRFLYVPPMTAEETTNVQLDLYSTAPYLHFLPQPKHIVGNKYWELDEDSEVVKKNAVIRAKL